MKNDFGNREGLLKQLALDGDPAAFYSLVAQYLEERYIRERKSGTSQQDALVRVVAEAADLQEQLQRVAAKNFNIWFDEHCTLLSVSESADKGETAADMWLPAEIEMFHSKCADELLKAGSEIRKQRLLHRRKFPGVLLRNRTAVRAIPLIAGLCVIVIALLVMSKTNVFFLVTLVTPENRFSLQIPPVDTTAGTPDTPVFLTGITDTVDTIASTVKDTAAVLADTTPARVVPPVKKTPPVPPRPTATFVEKKASPPVVSAPPRKSVPPVEPQLPVPVQNDPPVQTFPVEEPVAPVVPPPEPIYTDPPSDEQVE